MTTSPPDGVSGKTDADSRETLPPDDIIASASEAFEADAGREQSAPARLGRYRIERELGRGAMGAVYLAHDTELDRHVAIKIPKFSGSDAPEYLERFYREARAAATLRHANICPVYDVGEADAVRFITMAYVNGRPLDAEVKAGTPLPERRAAELVAKLADALDHAHRRSVIHRDLKPSNVLIDEEGEPIIMDFGLARQTNKLEDKRLTQSGMIIGSPAYMSPEQIEDGAASVGPRSDIYSLGVMLFELLTARLPFEGSVAAVIGQIITRDPPRPGQLRPELDPRLESICLKMMEKRPEDRYASMSDVVTALEDYLKQPKTSSVPASEPSDAQLRETLAPTGRTTVAAPGDRQATIDESYAAARIGVPRWILWSGIATVALAFGLTWWMMSIALSGATQADQLLVDSRTREALTTLNAELFIDNVKVTPEELADPKREWRLEPGEHTVVIKSGENTVLNQKHTVNKGEHLQLNITYDGTAFHVEEQRSRDPAAGEIPTEGQPADGSGSDSAAGASAGGASAAAGSATSGSFSADGK